MEEWKAIENYPNYEVSNLGNVINKTRNSVVKPYLNRDEHLYVRLWKNNKEKHFSVHRLVATAFIINTNNKPSVDHIDGNPSNNNVNNLRWCNHSENQWNAKLRCDNALQCKGIYFEKARNKYVARIKQNGKNIWTKRFDKLEDAKKAREEKTLEICGEFARNK